MAKKLSAYQKLKAKNLELYQDINTLMKGDETSMEGMTEYFRVHLKHSNRIALEKAIWTNTIPDYTGKFDGFISKITNGKD